MATRQAVQRPAGKNPAGRYIWFESFSIRASTNMPLIPTLQLPFKPEEAMLLQVVHKDNQALWVLYGQAARAISTG